MQEFNHAAAHPIRIIYKCVICQEQLHQASSQNPCSIVNDDKGGVQCPPGYGCNRKEVAKKQSSKEDKEEEDAQEWLPKRKQNAMTKISVASAATNNKQGRSAATTTRKKKSQTVCVASFFIIIFVRE